MTSATHNARVLALLSDGKPHSHIELYDLHVIAHSRVSDLRAKGHAIESWREGDLYLYRLEEVEHHEAQREARTDGGSTSSSSARTDPLLTGTDADAPDDPTVPLCSGQLGIFDVVAA